MTEERYIEIDSMNEEQAGTIEEAERLEYNRMNYIKETDQESAFEDLLAQIETAQQGYLNVWQTGFSLLDDKLDGGFLGGNLIILGAVSSLGKTTFALQIADQIASFGKDVLIFSLEMSKKELNAKSISRNTFKITDRGITKDKYPVRDPRQKYRVTMGDVLRGRVGLRGEAKRELFEEALTMSRKQSEHIFIWRDNDVDLDKIADIIQLHKDIHNQSPFVIIDYLQILKARQESKTTDKRLLTDDDVNRLKDLAEEKDLPIMVISSFNRTNYIEPASMIHLRRAFLAVLEISPELGLLRVRFRLVSGQPVFAEIAPKVEPVEHRRTLAGVEFKLLAEGSPFVLEPRFRFAVRRKLFPRNGFRKMIATERQRSERPKKFAPPVLFDGRDRVVLQRVVREMIVDDLARLRIREPLDVRRLNQLHRLVAITIIPDAENDETEENAEKPLLATRPKTLGRLGAPLFFTRFFFHRRPYSD